MSGPSPELRARVLAGLSSIPAPTRSEHRARSLRIASLGLVATVAVFLVLGGFLRGARPMQLVVFTSGLALLVAMILTRLSMTSAPHSMLGRPRSLLLLACIATAPLLALVPVLADSIWPEADQAPLRADLMCSMLSLVEGAVPLAFFLVLRSGTDPVHPTLQGATLGLTAGAWSGTMAYLRCPHADVKHCIVAHGMVPALVLLAVGAVAGRRLLRLR